MDGTLLYTLSTKLHSKTIKKNVLAYPIKIAKKKKLFITDSASFHPAKSYIYIYMPNLHISAL